MALDVPTAGGYSRAGAPLAHRTQIPIGNTTTRSGFVVRAKIDRRPFRSGNKIPAKEMRARNIVRGEIEAYVSALAK